MARPADPVKLRGADLPAYGLAIRERREARRMKQSALGSEIGLSQAQVSRLETGESLPSVPQIKRIAAALGCKPADLIGPQ